MQECRARRDAGAACDWLITLRPNGEPLGSIELRPQGHRAELGYVLARPRWNQGYTTEAARAVVDWALAQPDLGRVWAVCDVENAASARVLENLGMRREGLLRRWAVRPSVGGPPADCYCYAITR